VTWHLAQLNVGRSLEPLDTPTMQGFMDALDPINALADVAPGFVWRLQTDGGNATDIKAIPDDPLFILNMSVWESLETLGDFVYRSDHVAIMRQRAQWFERMAEAIVVLWWVPAGTIPTVTDALERLDHLRRHGPTAEAFTFRQPFPAPDGEATPEPERDVCRA
jgi:hypothetical protein